MNTLARWVCETGGNWRLRLALVAALFAIVAGALSFGATAAVAAPAKQAGVVGGAGSAPMLPPAGDYPDAPCTLANRMNIYVARDGTVYECMCEILAKGFACDWYAQFTVAAERLRRRAKARLHVRVLPRMVVLRV